MPVQPATEVYPTTLQPPRAPWAPLYHIGAIAAVAVVALMVVHTVVFLRWPPPGYTPTAENTRAWFALFDSSPLLALVNLDLLMLVDFVCVVLTFVALCVVLWRTHRVSALLGGLLVVMSAAVYLASNPAFTMQALARGHAASAADRELYVAAGQATLALYHGTPFDVGYVLSAIAGIIVSVALLRSRELGAATATLGLVMFVMNLVPPTVGTIGVVLSMASLPLLAIWLLLVSRRLWALARALPAGGSPG